MSLSHKHFPAVPQTTLKEQISRISEVHIRQRVLSTSSGTLSSVLFADESLGVTRLREAGAARLCWLELVSVRPPSFVSPSLLSRSRPLAACPRPLWPSADAWLGGADLDPVIGVRNSQEIKEAPTFTPPPVQTCDMSQKSTKSKWDILLS